ncbi:hypothetical protein Hamer_G004022, partial [Homarus americanus]
LGKVALRHDRYSSIRPAGGPLALAPPHDASTREILPGVFMQVELAKYLVLCIMEGKPVMDLDIFILTGKEPKIFTQQDGSPLVEVSSPKESALLCALSEVPGAPVFCTSHATFNQCRGMVFSKQLLWYSEKLLAELQVQKVVKVNSFHKKENGTLNHTPILLLTFECFKIPTSIKVAWIFQGETICPKLWTMLQLSDVRPSQLHFEAHPASSSGCDQFRIKKELLNICMRDNMSFAEARSTALKFISSHDDNYAQARQTVAGTPPRESSVAVLNSAPPPEYATKPQTSPVVAQVHMDEAGTSATPHLSSTSHPGTTRISAKCNLGSSKSLEVDDPPNKISMMPTDPLPEVSGDKTPAKVELAAGTPDMDHLSIFHLGSHLQGLTMMTSGSGDHYPILLSSPEVLPTPQVPCWWLDKMDWDLFKELVKVDKNIEEFPSADEAVEYLASLFQGAVLRVNDGSLVATPLEVADLFATEFADLSSMATRSSEFKCVSGVEESQTLDFVVGRGETFIIMFSLKEVRAALSLTGDTSPGPDDIPFSMLSHLEVEAQTFLLELCNRI